MAVGRGVFGFAVLAGGVVAGLAILNSRSQSFGDTVNILITDAGLPSDPRTLPVQGIVIHHSDTGSPESTRAVLKQRGLSTNFEVDRDGTVYQYLDPETRVAWATGSKANAHTIGIDLTHTGAQAFTDAQVLATKQLCAFLAQKFGFALNVAPADVVQEWPAWAGSGYTLFRHRNFHATACPGGAPVEAFV